MPITDDPDIQWAKTCLTSRYQESHRVYHDLRHIEDLLTAIPLHATDPTDQKTLALAAWFHDAVYDPKQGSPQNEEQSLALFNEIIGDRLSDRMRDAVRDIIQATAYHHTVQSGLAPLTEIFLDMDMGNFIKPYEVYADYTQRVFDEYVQAGYSMDDVRHGQQRFAQSLLDKPSWYYTPAFQQHEAQARANVTRWLQEQSRPRFTP